MNHAIARRRLSNQRLAGKAYRRPEEVVAWQGAVQAQEYPAARWGLALRMDRGPTDKAIERAVDEGRILRTHVMRPTWHFVTPGDIRWMLDLTAPRVRQRMAIYARNQARDASTVSKSLGIFERALGDGAHLIRAELGERLARGGISAKGIRLALLTMFAELEGLICSGPYRGKQLTYASLALRAPKARPLPRDEALAELTLRYFRSHGPATIRDFVWWSGLTTADAKRGLEMIRATHEVVEGLKYSSVERTERAGTRNRGMHLLPIYDEYLVAYRDRDAVPHVATMPSKSRPTNFQHPIVIGGQVAGTWRVRRAAKEASLEVALIRRLKASERKSLADVTAEYERFIELANPMHLVLLTGVTP